MGFFHFQHVIYLAKPMEHGLAKSGHLIVGEYIIDCIEKFTINIYGAIRFVKEDAAIIGSRAICIIINNNLYSLIYK